VAGDAGHLAAASNVRLTIELESLPLASGVRREAGWLNESPGGFAAVAGEDYELLLAMPPEFDSADAFRHECGIALTAIGRVEEGKGAGFLLEGKPVELTGYSHFG
jgi:thiamine-monophosphate kinase